MKHPYLGWLAFSVLAVTIGIIQFIPSQPVVFPVELPIEERAEHRLINFEGIDNFRDLGGYQTADGRTVKWGKLYRSANLAKASRSDQLSLSEHKLHALIDLRSAAEKQEEPNQLPENPGFKVLEIPILDGELTSLSSEIKHGIENDDLTGLDPDTMMIAANRQLVSNFSPQYREFFTTVVAAKGQPLLWHCTAGKDRTGFASALLLRILGVPQQTILDDYALSKDYVLSAHSRDLTLLRWFKSDETVAKVTTLLGVDKRWLQAAFSEIDQRYGSFDNYRKEALQLTDADVQQLRNTLLE